MAVHWYWKPIKSNEEYKTVVRKELKIHNDTFVLYNYPTIGQQKPWDQADK